MFNERKEINLRPRPFQFHTADEGKGVRSFNLTDYRYALKIDQIVSSVFRLDFNLFFKRTRFWLTEL
jgi:hypothetical protein